MNPRIALLLPCLGCAALAAQAADVPADELREVVVTATALREAAHETTQPITVVTGEGLVRRRASSLGETLAALPGVTATYFGPQASRPVIRGLGGERVQMYEDGAEALDVSALSNDHAVTIDPLLAESIEVIRGPATLLYGSGAAGGLVNTRTNRVPGWRSPQPFAGALELRGNSAAGERSGAAHIDGGTGPWLVHADVHARDTDDLSIPGFALSRPLREQLAAAGEAVDETRGTLANSSSETWGGALGSSVRGEWGFAGLAVSRFGADYGIPGLHEHVEGHEHEEEEEHAAEEGGVRIDMAQTRIDLNSELLSPWRGVAALRLRAARNDYEHAEVEPTGEIGTRFEQRGYDGRLMLDHEPFGGWRGTVGLQRREVDLTAIGAEAFVPASDTRTVGLFAYEERDFGPLTLEAGARFERQQIEAGAAQSLPGYDEDSVSASLGALWRFAPQYALALNLTSTGRHPTATELYADGPHLAAGRFERGDAELRRERARTVDLGLRRTAGAWRMSLAAFLSDYSRYVYASPTGLEEDGLPLYQYVQADARFTGVEAELELPVLQLPAGTLATRLTADYVRARLGSGGDLPQIPPFRVGGEIAYERGPFAVALGAMWHDSQERVAANELPTDGYTLVDLDLSYRRPLGERSVLLFLRGENLLDEEARRNVSPLKDVAPLPGRAVAGGVRFEF